MKQYLDSGTAFTDTRALTPFFIGAKEILFTFSAVVNVKGCINSNERGVDE
jgi:hypothetical protein